MQLTRRYAGSKALVAAVELALFTTLANGPLTGAELRARLGLQPRGTLDTGRPCDRRPEATAIGEWPGLI